MASGDDGETTLVELRSLVETFVKDRQWEGFHTPENLSQAISVEAAELLECFLWLSRTEADSRMKDPAGRAAVVDELADVIIYALSLANALQVDVSTAVRDKLDLNERRFPVAAWRGRARADSGTAREQSVQAEEFKEGACEH